MNDIQTIINQIREWNEERQQNRAALFFSADEDENINSLIWGRQDIIVSAIIRSMMSDKNYRELILLCVDIYKKLREEAKKNAQDEDKPDAEQQP
jgi:hypothetical protein